MIEMPNPALAAFGAFIGTWVTTGSHPYFPDLVFHGKVSFEWFHGGAFVKVDTSTVEPEIPDGVAMLGSDDTQHTLWMLYFDERGVSRRYEMSLEGDTLRWWRDSPEFSQRFTCTIAPDGRTMEGRGEMSRDGAAWEPDLALSYSRVDHAVT